MREADKAQRNKDEGARHYDEQGLATLVIMIATANLFTRLGTATRQVAGVPKREGERAHRT